MQTDKIQNNHLQTERQDHPYRDILHLPHPVSAKHPQMPIADRAAQFSPFAALTGHEALIQETRRIHEENIDKNS